MSTALTEKPGADVLPRASGASALLNGHYAPPPEDKEGKTWVRTSALVQEEAQKLYELWHDLERVPSWQEEVVSVTRTGAKTSHWVLNPVIRRLSGTQRRWLRNLESGLLGDRSAAMFMKPVR